MQQGISKAVVMTTEKDDLGKPLSLDAIGRDRAGEFHKRNKGSFPQALKTRLTPFKPEERGHQVPGRFRP